MHRAYDERTGVTHMRQRIKERKAAAYKAAHEPPKEVEVTST